MVMGMGMVMAVIMRVAVIVRVLFEVLVMMLMGMIMATPAATAAAALLLMRRMIFRFQIEHFVMVLMRMIVAAPATMIMMVMVVAMIVVMPMIMIVRMMMTVVAALIIGTTLRLERTLDSLHRATQTTQHFDKHMIIFDVDRVRRDFRWCVAIADVPRRLHQAGRIFRTDFNKLLRRGFDGDQAAIFKLQRIAIVQHDGLIEIEQKIRALLALQRHAAAMATFMIQRNAVDHFFGLHGGLTNGLGGAEHRKTSLTNPYLGDWRGRCQPLLMLPAPRLHDDDGERYQSDG